MQNLLLIHLCRQTRTGIMLSEISQRKIIIWFHSYAEYIELVQETIRERRETERGGVEKLERKTNHERFLTLGNKGLQKGRRVGGWGDWVMGTKEGT